MPSFWSFFFFLHTPELKTVVRMKTDFVCQKKRGKKGFFYGVVHPLLYSNLSNVNPVQNPLLNLFGEFRHLKKCVVFIFPQCHTDKP